MQRRQEVCRNFQRGSCQYGARCKFLHPVQQQTSQNPFGFGAKPTTPQRQLQTQQNTFGFGLKDNTQQRQPQQQTQQNPHGFGVKAPGQQRDSSFGARNQNQFKPIENKWNRFSTFSSSAATTSRQTETQGQVVEHKCVDPEQCKQLIAEDFKNEQPLWKLTCYAHWKYLPCDLHGDISYEELRASAYADARQGVPLQSIIERERNMLNSRLSEFNSLLQSPYVSPSGGTQAAPFSGAFLSSPQLHASQPAIPFGVTASTGLLPVGTSTSQQASPSQAFSPLSSAFTSSSGAAFTKGLFSNQVSVQPFRIAGNANTNNFHNEGNTSKTSPFSSVQNIVNDNADSPFSSVSSTRGMTNNMLFPNNMPDCANSGTDGAMLFNTNNSSHNYKESPTDVGDMSIWLKEEWKIGEIPEDEPPKSVV